MLSPRPIMCPIRFFVLIVVQGYNTAALNSVAVGSKLREMAVGLAGADRPAGNWRQRAALDPGVPCRLTCGALSLQFKYSPHSET